MKSPSLQNFINIKNGLCSYEQTQLCILFLYVNKTRLFQIKKMLPKTQKRVTISLTQCINKINSTSFNRIFFSNLFLINKNSVQSTRIKSKIYYTYCIHIIIQVIYITISTKKNT